MAGLFIHVETFWSALDNPSRRARIKALFPEGDAVHIWIKRRLAGVVFFAVLNPPNHSIDPSIDPASIVGAAIVLYDEARGGNYRLGIIVEPAFRRRKIGTQLYRAARERFGPGLFASPHDDEGKAFFRSVGAPF